MIYRVEVTKVISMSREHIAQKYISATEQPWLYAWNVVMAGWLLPNIGYLLQWEYCITILLDSYACASKCVIL